MSRWFRHYAGMMRDEKLVRVAVKAKQPVERVVWIWGAILESAEEINDAGRFEFDAGEAAYFLRCDEADLVCVVECLENLGRISGGVVTRWSERQFDSDSAKERQRRYRERRKAGSDIQQLHDDVGEASSGCIEFFFAPAHYRMPKVLWVAARKRIFERDDYTCQYCGIRAVALECDHVIPVCRGGSDDDNNLTTACQSCNRSKRDMLVSEWRQ